MTIKTGVAIGATFMLAATAALIPVGYIGSDGLGLSPDKIAHCLVAAGVGGALMLALPRSLAPLVLVALFAAGALIEFFQPGFGRMASIEDAMANGFGLSLAGTLRLIAGD